jgi:hypothetical protein
MQTPMAHSVVLARGARPAENLRIVSGLQKSALPASSYLAHPPGYEQSYVVPARTCCPQRRSGQPWWPSRYLPSSSARQCGGPLRLSPNLRSLSCHQCQTRGCRLPPCQRRACRRQSGRPCTAPRAWSRVTRQEVEPARRFSARWCPVELLFQGSKKGRLGGRVEEPSWAEEGDDAPSSSRAGSRQSLRAEALMVLVTEPDFALLLAHSTHYPYVLLLQHLVTPDWTPQQYRMKNSISQRQNQKPPSRKCSHLEDTYVVLVA